MTAPDTDHEQRAIDLEGENQPYAAHVYSTGTVCAGLDEDIEAHLVAIEMAVRHFGPGADTKLLPLLLFTPVRLAELVNSALIAGINAWGNGFLPLTSACRKHAPEVDLTDTHPEDLPARFREKPATVEKGKVRSRLGFSLDTKEDT